MNLLHTCDVIFIADCYVDNHRLFGEVVPKEYVRSPSARDERDGSVNFKLPILLHLYVLSNQCKGGIMPRLREEPTLLTAVQDMPKRLNDTRAMPTLTRWGQLAFMQHIIGGEDIQS